MRCSCGNSISQQRSSLGYKTCLECGNAQAQKQKLYYQSQVVPIAHKSGLTFVGDSLRKHLTDLNKVVPTKPLDLDTSSIVINVKEKVVRRECHGFYRDSQGQIVLKIRVIRQQEIP